MIIACNKQIQVQRKKNINHNLWQPKLTWMIHYTVYPTPNTAIRIRHSLKTRDVKIARQTRDIILGITNV